MLSKIKKLHPILLFFIKFGLLLLIWELLYSLFLEKDGRLDAYLTNLVSGFSVKILQWTAYAVESEGLVDGSQVIFLEGERLLRIAHPCNGLILQVLFVSFLVSFSGDLLMKIITMFIGTLGIFLINVSRVYALVLIQMYAPEYLNFSHKYLFTAIVYGFVFCIWLLWVNKLSNIKLISK